MQNESVRWLVQECTCDWEACGDPFFAKFSEPVDYRDAADSAACRLCRLEGLLGAEQDGDERYLALVPDDGPAVKVVVRSTLMVVRVATLVQTGK